MKISFRFHIAPTESADQAFERFKVLCQTDKILRRLGPDCDFSPAIWRTWMIPKFPGWDLLEVAFEAWTLLGELLSIVVQALEGPFDLTMPCRPDPKRAHARHHSQQEFFLEVDSVTLTQRWSSVH